MGFTRWTTSLFAKDGPYVVPLKSAIPKAEGVSLGDTVNVRLGVEL